MLNDSFELFSDFRNVSLASLHFPPWLNVMGNRKLQIAFYQLSELPSPSARIMLIKSCKRESICPGLWIISQAAAAFFMLSEIYSAEAPSVYNISIIDLFCGFL